MNVRPRILIVEDNSIVAVDIKARVERMGYEITDCVTRGQNAIDSAMRETPNLILMDIKLKGERRYRYGSGKVCKSLSK